MPGAPFTAAYSRRQSSSSLTLDFLHFKAQERLHTHMGAIPSPELAKLLATSSKGVPIGGMYDELRLASPTHGQLLMYYC